MKNSSIELTKTSLLAGALPEDVRERHDQFSVLRRLTAPFWIFDIDRSRILFANASACLLWQAKDEAELYARDLTQNMSAMVSKRLQQYRVDFIERDATFTEQWTLYPNGEPTSVMVVYKGYRLSDGRMGMQCEVVERSDNAPENLRSAEALLHTDVMITLYSFNDEMLYMNPAARNAAMRSKHKFSDLFLNAKDHENTLLAIEKTGEHRLVSRVFTGVGPRWYDLSAKRCTDAVTGEPALLVTAIDVSELKVARDKAKFFADRDQLTGCYNRTFIQHHFETLVNAQIGKCALIYFDIDKFKNINDGFGHEMGDVVLRKLASRARKLIRIGDVMARLGGDEFVMLLHDIQNERNLDHKVNDLRRAFSAPIHHGGTHLSVTVSMGVTIFEPKNVEFDNALRDADVALYISKQDGRDKATYFSEEIGAKVKERRLFEADIKRGIEGDEFVLYYQPRIDLRSGRIVSAEALVRWEHPQQGLVPPDRFIPICEDTGMIERLGQRVLEMGCQQAMKWSREGVDIGVSINISPRQFQNNQLLKTLEKFAQIPGFPRQKVELEITENVLIGDRDRIADKLHTITKLGYRIAIDDFGTGYSNLSYISQFPLNCIKIDKSFISQLPRSGPIIQLILTLAKQVNAIAVAEGVETQQEYDWLLAESCDQVQGYYLSKAVPVDALMATVEKRHLPLV